MPTQLLRPPPGTRRATTETTSRRVAALLAVVALCAAAAVVVVLHARSASGSHLVRSQTVAAATPAELRRLESAPFLIYRSTALDTHFGRLALVPADDPSAAPYISDLRCDRVDFAAGRGVCLTRSTSGVLTTTRAVVFDAALRPIASTALAGFPSRARMSPDGKLATTTTFVAGDSYATMGRFSTRTVIFDAASGATRLRLDQLTVTRDGQTFRRADFNFWGVTFERDDQHFYATLGSGGTTYLLHGDIATKTAVVVTTGVECPSLSPDGTRIAFKQRVPGRAIAWRPAVLDLATLHRHLLADPRHVDDQIAWLDNDTVVYGLAHSQQQLAQLDSVGPGMSALVTGGSIATDTWAAPADGSGTPRRLLAGAWSLHEVGH